MRKRKQLLEIYVPDNSTEIRIPLSVANVHAGFPSPAQDFLERSIDLNRELVKNPASTFYARVEGDSMIDLNIEEGDLLVIDKSIEPTNGTIAVCYIDGEFTLKRVELHKDYLLLIPANKRYKSIKVTEDNEFMIWGVVRYVIKKFF